MATLLSLSEALIAVWASNILPHSPLTLKIDILGINSSTRNATISVTGSHNNLLTGNMTIDLLYPGSILSRNLPLTLPIAIISSLLHDRDESRSI
ncbi:MAG TPA: hypothetical protein VE130_10060 [Nitrososphaeraceae archaeon]|nr:hypothetical protein [Nitrososphaeraceae archaeon]